MVMIKKKERAALYLIQEFEPISKMELVKRLFLVSVNNEIYNFIPYKYGPFSFELYKDLGHLERIGFISQHNEKISLKETKYPDFDVEIRRALNLHISEFSDYSTEELRKYVYDKYPSYTIFSKIERKEGYNRNESGITTIGYEGRNIDEFLLSLIKNKISLLIDVRNNSHSMKYGFSKNQLSKYLNELEINYLHLPNLGIKSDKRQNLDKDGYLKLFEDYRRDLNNKEKDLKYISELAKKEKIALMCFEKNPNCCHRGVLRDYFKQKGKVVMDI